MCGLVDAGTFSSYVKAVSPNKVVIAIGALLLAILMTPFLKLWLVRSDEPYRKIDQLALRISFYLLVAILTIAILDGLRYQSLNQKMNDSMKSIATSVVKSFKEELDEATDRLNAFESHQEFEFNENEINGIQLQRVWADAFETAHENKGNSNKYPQFEILGVVNYSGFTLSSFDITTRDREISGGNVKHRDYFNKAKYGPRWQIGVCSNLKNGCFIERIFSMNEGVKMSAIVTLSKLTWPIKGNNSSNKEDKPRINALFKRFQTFMSPPLPPGFQFAVVRDSDGTVLFHSNEKFSMVENFYDETAQDPDLTAAIRTLRSMPNENTPIRHFDGEYHGTEHTFAVAPLAIPDWTLVVMREMRLVQAVNAETIIASFSGIFMFLNLLVLMAWCLRPIYAHPVCGWIRPNVKHPERYLPICILLLIIAITEVVIIFGQPHPIDSFLLFVLLTVLTMSASFGLLTPESKYKDNRLKKGLPAVLGMTVVVIFWIVSIRHIVFMGEGVSIEGVVSGSGIYPLLLMLFFGLWLIYYTNFLNSKRLTYELADCKECAVKRHHWFSVLFFTIMAVLPAWSIFEMAWRNNLEAFLQKNVTAVSYAMDEMEEVFREDAIRINKDNKIDKIDRSYIPESDFIGFCEKGDFCPDKSDPNVHADDKKPTRMVECNTEKDSPLYNWFGSNLSVAKIIEFVPKVSPDSGMLRSYFPEEKSTVKHSHNWHWKSDCYFVLEGNDESTEHTENVKIEETVFKNKQLVGLRNNLPIEPGSWWGMESFLGKVVTVLLFLGLFWLFQFLLKKITNRLFGFDYLVSPKRFVTPHFKGPDKEVEEAERKWWIETGINRIIIRPDFSVGDKLAFLAGGRTIKVIDLSSASKTLILTPETGQVEIFILENFQSNWHDVEIKYNLIGDLLKLDNRLIYIVSDMDPSLWLEAHLRQINPKPEEVEEQMDEWTTLLEKFQKVYGDVFKVPDWRDETSEAQAILSRECSWSSTLEKVGKEIKAHPEFSSWGEEEILLIISDRAEGYYKNIWRSCNEDEQRMLYQLAKGYNFNPQNSLTMQHLIQCGYIVADPEYKIPGESFRRFILHAEPEKHIQQWENQSYGGVWPVLRLPLIALMVAAAGILFFMRPETFRALTGFLAALAAGLPIIIRLFSSSSAMQK